MAAVRNVAQVSPRLREPRAHSAPQAKRRESPGRKGVMTSPVSAKTMPHKMAYVAVPYFAVIAASSLSCARVRMRLGVSA